MTAVILLALSAFCLVKPKKNLHWKANFSLMPAMILVSVSFIDFPLG